MLKNLLFIIAMPFLLVACGSSGSGGQNQSVNNDPESEQDESTDSSAAKSLPYFFVGEDDRGKELWKSDGTEEGTVIVKDINAAGDSYPIGLLLVDDVIYFYATDGIHGRELWRSDGTQEGTYMVVDVNAKPTGIADNTADAIQFESMVSVAGIVYFAADDGVRGEELWRSDGTADGTYLLKEILAGNGSSSITNITAVEDKVFFNMISGGSAKRGLWVSDGSEAGTIQLSDEVEILGGKIGFKSDLYFIADDGVSGRELWKSDGTILGTVRVKDINPSGSSGPDHFTKNNDYIYFRANDVGGRNALWKSDGTEAGTVLLKDNDAGINQFNPQKLTVSNEVLYFTADDGYGDRELWKSDGTNVGTVLVKNIHPSGSSDTSNIWSVNGVIYFGADDSVSGYELWRSDGTEDGTVQVADINIGFSGSSPSLESYVYSIGSKSEPYVFSDGRFFLNANDGVDGRELYLSDGKAGGTTARVKDIAAGPSSGFYNDDY